jgi:hypothetical protein
MPNTTLNIITMFNVLKNINYEAKMVIIHSFYLETMQLALGKFNQI